MVHRGVADTVWIHFIASVEEDHELRQFESTYVKGRVFQFEVDMHQVCAGSTWYGHRQEWRGLRGVFTLCCGLWSGGAWVERRSSFHERQRNGTVSHLSRYYCVPHTAAVVMCVCRGVLGRAQHLGHGLWVAEHGFGSKGLPPFVPPNACVVYEVTLLKIVRSRCAIL